MDNTELFDKKITNHPHTQNNHISTFCTLTVIAISSLLLFLIISFNIIFDMSLFVLGVNLSYQLQQSLSSELMKIIGNLISYLCKSIFMGIIIIFSYVLINRKLMLLVYLSYYLFANYIYHVLNQIIQETRPFWYDSRIQKWQWQCPANFGNPSGHSLNAVIFLQPIISDGLGLHKFRFFWVFILIFIAFFVPLCRVYLGSHSLNQILFGMSLGGILLVLYKYLYQKSFYLFFWSLINNGSKRLKVIGTVILNLIVILLPIGFYQINSKQRPINPKYLQNLIIQCQKHVTSQQLQDSKFIACSIGCFIFGVIYGLLLLKNNKNYHYYFLGLWKAQNNLKKLLTLVISVISAGLPFGFFYLIQEFLAKNAIDKYLLNCGAMIGLGLGLSLLAPLLAFKFKLIKLVPLSSENS